MSELKPLGDRAFLAYFESETAARRWVSAVRARAPRGVLEVTLAYSSAGVFIDPDVVDPAEIEQALRALDSIDGETAAGTLHHLPVLYDGEDLADAARLLHLTESEVIQQHTAAEYVVLALGFLPGFPYLGYLPRELAGVPRLETPRVRVPTGSVAIAGKQTGIYPRESPGGWRLIGRTPVQIVDLNGGYFPIATGDRIRFESINEPEFRARLGEPFGRA